MNTRPGYMGLASLFEKFQGVCFPEYLLKCRPMTLTVTETFLSIQGESTYAGLTCFFIRLTGCNLRCRYCDATYAYEGGRETSVADLVSQACSSGAAVIEVTGGEPLIHGGFALLAERLRDESSRPVLVETNGSLDISVIPEGVHAIVDMKCPGSGESDRMDLQNLGRLRPTDEVKFVVSDRRNYEWARELVTSGAISSRCKSVLFSPAWGLIDAGQLASWIVEDHLPVRLQLQLHKLLNVR